MKGPSGQILKETGTATVAELQRLHLRLSRIEGAGLIRSGVVPGEYGDGTSTLVVTVDSEGNVTSIEKIPITGAPPTGAVGGVLSGTMPNPGFAVDMATQAELDAHTSLNTTAHGGIVAASDARLTDARTPTGTAGGDLAGTYPNPSVTDDSHAHTAATLSGVVKSGDAAGGDLTGTYPNPTLGAVGSASGPIGSSTVIPIVTIDAKGRVTALSSAAIGAAAPAAHNTTHEIGGTDPVRSLTMAAIATPAAPVVNKANLFERLNGATIELIRQSVTGAECIICTLPNFVHTNTLAFNLIE